LIKLWFSYINQVPEINFCLTWVVPDHMIKSIFYPMDTRS
jgi:hypothetical protein